MPELPLQIGLVGRVDIAGGGEQDVDDIAGHDAQQHEDDDRDPEQGHEHQYEAPHDIGKHLAVLPLARILQGRRPAVRLEYAQVINPASRVPASLCRGGGYLSSHTSS